MLHFFSGFNFHMLYHYCSFYRTEERESGFLNSSCGCEASRDILSKKREAFLYGQYECE